MCTVLGAPGAVSESGAYVARAEVRGRDDRRRRALKLASLWAT